MISYKKGDLKKGSYYLLYSKLYHGYGLSSETKIDGFEFEKKKYGVDIKGFEVIIYSEKMYFQLSVIIVGYGYYKV